MNSVLNTMLLSALIILIFYITDSMSINEEAEQEYSEYFWSQNNGEVTFPDNKSYFCHFMRPRGYIYFGYSLKEGESIALDNGSPVVADLCTCSYGQSEHGSSTRAPTYSRGPISGDYYEMRTWPQNSAFWQLGDKVNIPSRANERVFYDYWDGDSKIRFMFNEKSFCENRVPNFASDDNVGYGSIDVSMTLKRYGAGTVIPIELCKCKYFYGGSSLTVYYAEGPSNSIYEVREWDFKNDESDTWVVWTYVETIRTS